MRLKWLPDWKDPSQYPDFKLLNCSQQAWEFLRRNPNYQQDFERFTLYGDDAIQFIPRHLIQTDISGNTYIITEENYYKLSEHIENLKNRRTSKKTNVKNDFQLLLPKDTQEIAITDQFFDIPKLTIEEYFVYKYGLKARSKLPDPSLGAEHYSEIRFEIPSIKILYHSDPFQAWGLKPDLPEQIAMVLNLSLPNTVLLKKINDKIKHARTHLKETGQLQGIVPKRNRSSVYKNYLRVLDAYTENVEIRVLSTIIFPQKSNAYPDYLANQCIYHYYSSATNIRDGAYLNIFNSDD